MKAWSRARLASVGERRDPRRARRVEITPEVVVTPELGEFRSAWDELVAVAPVPSPYMRSWWLEAYASEQSAFVLVVEDDRLLGGLPLDLARRFGLPMFRVMGTRYVPVAHIDVLAVPSERHRVTNRLHRWFADQDCWIQLDGLVENSDLAAILPGRSSRTIDEVLPWMPLPATFEEYMESRPRKHRRTVQAAIRRLEAEGAEHRIVTLEDLPRSLEDTRRLHSELLPTGSRFLATFGRFETAATLGMERGELSIEELHVGDEVIAANVYLDFAEVIHGVQFGRSLDHRWHGAGSVLIAKMIEQACDRGYKALDMGLGGQDYKYRWVDHKRYVYRMEATNGLLSSTIPRIEARPAGAKALGMVMKTRRMFANSGS